MMILRNPKELRTLLDTGRHFGKKVGFVPTMGALHEGHLSLVRAARRENDVAVVSLFVNPLQFGPREDLKKYPRPFARDCRLLEKEKVDYFFYPTANTMYPKGFRTQIQVPELSEILCGKFRPGHFSGVATVVAKLFHAVGPATAYFGAKDYQQTRVIDCMIRDLDFPVVLKVLPTIRERDGLAMSSRNQYLSAADRRRAATLSQTLFGIRREIFAGVRNLAVLKRRAWDRLRRHVNKIDYLEIVDPESLKSLSRIQPKMVALGACFVGKTRLIDNVIIRLPKTGSRRD